MIFYKTILKSGDNSGPRFVRCIKILRTVSAYGKKNYGNIGDLILVSVRYVLNERKIRKGTLLKALIVRTKRKVKRMLGFLGFFENAVLFLDKKMQPLGTRVFGPFAREVRVKKYERLGTISRYII